MAVRSAWAGPISRSSGVGGNSLDAQANITGGEGIGGTRLIRILNGGTLSAELFAGGSGALGGNGSGTGNGGNATGGSNRIEINNGTPQCLRADVRGRSGLFGGSGDNGGDAVAGTVEFEAVNATLNFDPDSDGDFGLILGGQSVGGNGVVTGGDAIGEAVSLVLQDSNGHRRQFPDQSAHHWRQCQRAGGALVGTPQPSAQPLPPAVRPSNCSATISSRPRPAGGNGGPEGTDGEGGDAQSGVVVMDLTDSQVSVESRCYPAALAGRTGGQGDQIGKRAEQ